MQHSNRRCSVADAGVHRRLPRTLQPDRPSHPADRWIGALPIV